MLKVSSRVTPRFGFLCRSGGRDRNRRENEPKILFFDEATSALDNVTQKKISEALDAMRCTRIVIAHCLSTIRQCDRILVLDQGKIIEDGTYDELIEKNGFFADLVSRQQLEEATKAKKAAE